MKAKVLTKNRIISKKGEELYILRVFLVDKFEIVAIFVEKGVFDRYHELDDCTVEESVYYRNERGFVRHDVG